jgi:ribonuclease E
LIEATHPEETRVVVVDGKRLDEFDYETASKRQLKGNIYLAKVTRVEPSLQAAFVEYGGNRHGFLAFSEIHPDYYQIPVADREALLAEQAALDAEGDDFEEDEPHRRGESAAETEPPAYAPAGGETGAEATAGEPPAVDADGEQPDAEFEQEHPDDGTNGGDEERAAALRVTSPRLEGPVVDRDVAEMPDAGEPAGAMVGEPELPLEPAAAGGEAPAGEASAEAPAAPASQAPRRTVVETVGGDETEEMRPRRVRHLRRYKIQEVIKRRQIMLVQVTKEERGNKGAALTTYLSLAGRYCVLMPNTARGGGISRKIASAVDRKRLKSILGEMEIPDGMAVIVRTAGQERNKTELKRDYEYLLRLWDEIRELTLKSRAPALIYEEANLVKRAIRDMYARDVEEILVEGAESYKNAKNFLRMLMPSHAKRVQLFEDPTQHLFQKFQVEGQIDAIHNPVVQLRSGGYIVINTTEALVAIDVNSGRSTRERNIEETALRTNLEAAEEVARQLRLRDLAGLIVIDFIDMEESRNNAAVERKLKEALRNDRARIQVGRISPFGLLELSRQRLRPSLFEASMVTCRHCRGTGHVRSTESTALHMLRTIEDEGLKQRSTAITVTVPTAVALYLLNNKRAVLAEIEARHRLRVTIAADDSLVPPDHRMDRSKAPLTAPETRAVSLPVLPAEELETEAEAEMQAEPGAEADEATAEEAAEPLAAAVPGEEAGGRRRRRRRRRRDGQRGFQEERPQGRPAVEAAMTQPAGAEEREEAEEGEAGEIEGGQEAAPSGEGRPQDGESGERRRRRRGRRGGRRRRRGGERFAGETQPGDERREDRPARPYPSQETGEQEHRPDGPPGYGAEPEAIGRPQPSPEAAESAPARVQFAPPPPAIERREAAPKAPKSIESPPALGPEPMEDRAEVADMAAPAGPPRRGWWKRLIE